MKLTEAKLKQLIKEVMTEAAKGISDLPDGVYVDVEKVADSYVIRYVTEDRKSPMKEFGFSGRLVTGPVKKLECLGAFQVEWVTVTPKGEGYAPLLYDIAMELTTLLGANSDPPTGGLTSDRYSVTDEAQKVWDYYLYNRAGPGGDVTVIQLDNEKDSFGDGVQNDCIQSIVRSTMTGLNPDFRKSPMSKVYRKQPTTLDALGDKLRLYGFELNLGNEESK